MAILPYQHDVEGYIPGYPYNYYTVNENFPAVVNWCIEQWPYTGGATWTWHALGQVLVTSDKIDRVAYWISTGKVYPLFKNMLRFTFQFESDSILFRMRWGDLSER